MLVSLNNAFEIAIVTWALNMSLVLLYSKKNGYATDSNQVRFLEYLTSCLCGGDSSVIPSKTAAVENNVEICAVDLSNMQNGA